MYYVYYIYVLILVLLHGNIVKPQSAQPYPESYPSQPPPSYDALYLAKEPDLQGQQASKTCSYYYCICSYILYTVLKCAWILCSIRSMLCY